MDWREERLMACCTCIACLGVASERCELCRGNGTLSGVDPDCAVAIEKLYPTHSIEERKAQQRENTAFRVGFRAGWYQRHNGQEHGSLPSGQIVEVCLADWVSANRPPGEAEPR